jgi:plasmid maintenance system killer protein
MVLGGRPGDKGFGYIMKHEENPFDRDSQSIPLIRFMLHTSSLSSEILTKDSPAHRLVKLNSFKEVEIIPLPIADNEIRKILNANGLVLTEYSSDELSVALKASDGSIHNVVSPFAKRLPENLWKPIIPDSKVVLADLFASSICDYLVVGVTEPSLKCKVAKDNIVTAEQALELVRILLTAHNHYYISAELRVNEGFYYLYRFKRLFKEFQHAWTVATYAHGKGLSEKINDHLASLSTRLMFICRAYDKVAFLALKTANYEDQSNQLYHLVYFVMLITGVFDNLARIIKERYQLKINDRWDISLRIPQNKKTTEFYKKLECHDVNLHDFLTAMDTQKDIKIFYPLRDSLTHRELPTGVQLQQNSEIGKNVFELNSEIFEELKNIADSPNFIIRGNPCFLDPLSFIKWAQEVTITLVNRVLSSIDWDSFCATLPADIQDKIHASNESFKQGVGQFLGWPKEPLYF